MAYKELLISTGGGIIKDSQKDEQESCATIAIGLGGTGVDCLKNLKRQVYERLQPDNPGSDIPQYSHVKFLAVDTDKASLNDETKSGEKLIRLIKLDERNEFFDISTPNIHALIAGAGKLHEKPEFKWLVTSEDGREGLQIKAAIAGAGAVRQIGRLLLMQKSSEFVHKMEILITEAKKGLPENSNLNIHIFSGLGGGTGSGIFLDICYLVQHALKNVGEYGHAKTFGYFFLPDVNLSVSELAANPAFSKIVKSNGFAAMKELDYCIDFKNNGGCWDQQYMGFHIKTDEEPVEICHLISATTISGMTLENGYDYAMNVVSDFVIQFMVKNAISMESHIANYARAQNMVPIRCGSSYKYCLLGAANAVVPVKEITTYLASKLFEKISERQYNLPTDEEILDFANTEQLTYEQLKKRLLKDTSYQMPFIPFDYKLFPSMAEEDLGQSGTVILPDVILKPYEKREEEMANVLEKNMQALTSEWNWENVGDDGSNASIVCNLYHSLARLIKAPQYGPRYVSVILCGSERKNLVALLRGVLEQAKKERVNTEKDMVLHAEAIKSARSSYLHPNVKERLKGRKKLFDQMIVKVKTYKTEENKIEMLKVMERMVDKLIDQIERLYRECFFVYEKVYSELSETLAENLSVLTDEDVSEAVADPFIIPLMTIRDMKESLDRTISEMQIDNEISSFNAHLFSNSKVWRTKETRKITAEIKDYFVNRFNRYTERTLTDYLEIKFGVTDAGPLANMTYDEILSPLSGKAKPLFWRDPRYNVTSNSMFGYCCVPISSAVVQTAANQMCSEDPNLKEVAINLTQRIFIIRCLCGIPMYAYNGIEGYYNEYKNDSSRGKHLYEGTKGDSRNWCKLIDIRPYSFPHSHSADEEKRSAIYEKAKDLEIIKHKNGNYYINLSDSINEIKEIVDQAIESRNYVKLKEAMVKLSDFDKRNDDINDILVIQNDGMEGMEEEVRKDHVLASDVKINALKSEIYKKDYIINSVRTIEDMIGSIKNSKKYQSEFFNVLMTNVIYFDGPIKLGYVEEDDYIIISSSTEKPYGDIAPIYQGFCNYKLLPLETRNELIDEANKRKNDNSPKIKEACQVLSKWYKRDSIDKMLGKVEMNFSVSEYIDIKEFLGDFIEELERFKSLFNY